jgi:hypothetical protein
MRITTAKGEVERAEMCPCRAVHGRKRIPAPQGGARRYKAVTLPAAGCPSSERGTWTR